MKSAWLAKSIIRKKQFKFPVVVIPIILVLTILCITLHIVLGFFGGSINRRTHKDEYKILCPSGFCYETTVWYNGEILECWYDDLPSATDSLKNLRMTWAKDLLHKAK